MTSTPGTKNDNVLAMNSYAGVPSRTSLDCCHFKILVQLLMNGIVICASVHRTVYLHHKIRPNPQSQSIFVEPTPCQPTNTQNNNSSNELSQDNETDSQEICVLFTHESGGSHRQANKGREERYLVFPPGQGDLQAHLFIRHLPLLSNANGKSRRWRAVV